MPSKSRRRKFRSLRQRDGDLCWICGEEMDFDLPRDNMRPEMATIDHVVPTSRGGSNRIENLRLAHQICNAVRGQGL